MSFDIKNIISGSNIRKIAIVGVIAIVAIPMIKKLKGGF